MAASGRRRQERCRRAVGPGQVGAEVDEVVLVERGPAVALEGLVGHLELLDGHERGEHGGRLGVGRATDQPCATGAAEGEVVVDVAVGEDEPQLVTGQANLAAAGAPGVELDLAGHGGLLLGSPPRSSGTATEESVTPLRGTPVLRAGSYVARGTVREHVVPRMPRKRRTTTVGPTRTENPVRRWRFPMFHVTCPHLDREVMVFDHHITPGTPTRHGTDVEFSCTCG